MEPALLGFEEHSGSTGVQLRVVVETAGGARKCENY
jgi:hypothetical protein